jgi:hypothetical protein
LDFEYRYDCDKERIDVADFGTDKIANLQKLCDLLTYNSVRIAVLDCFSNSIRYVLFCKTDSLR